MSGSGATSPDRVRALAGDAWLFRWQVEVEAEERFTRLSAALERLGAPAALVAMARRSAGDERRHAVHCARLAAAHGRPVPATPPPPAPPVAPSGLAEREAVTYELAAACCVTESVSVAVLTALLPEARDPGLRAVLQELAEDEVVHARLGWAHLASEHRRGATAFLGPWLPAMLAGSQDGDLFGPPPPGRDDAALLLAGVLPHARQRELFAEALREVVFPGLEQCGVDASAGRRWLDGQLARAS
ncbi:MAG: ferritin-like domain-containing protein [Deltaproteobacteria bacterium]|nr:ferritin-like domain-containing protein [Deltaproteobacteria bacterium]